MGYARVLGIMDKQESKFFPGVKTMESQGIKLYFASSRGLAAPAGTPKEIVDVLTRSIKNVINSEDHMVKMEAMGQTLRYMDPTEFETYWASMEKQVQLMIDQVKASPTK